ncbi:MAG: gliding motility-associated C-terminal domain-containing protein [Bacteroidia bacterium]|nr:gliding motility-associated C-terminal domain-containing protein [Bacteroidia bacterium]
MNLKFTKELKRKSFNVAYIFVCFLCFYASSSKAQVFYTETFDGTACGPTSGCDPSLVSWTTTVAGPQGANPNRFYVSCQENGNAAGACGTGCGTDQSLHVGNVSTSTAAFLFCPAGDCGAAYDDTGAGERTNVRAESPTINCTGQSNITISFNYMEGGEGLDDDASLVYFDGTTWTSINPLAKTPTCGGGQGQWTAFSMTLPASADNNPNVRIGFVWKNDGDGVAADPSFAVDDITLSVTSTNTITTGTITGSPFCACATVNVPFTSTGTFTAGNIYTAQLSDATGSFATPIAIGTLASTANAGNITATIPCNTPTGTAYRIRVVSSAPATTGTDNGVNITINATVTPSVTISANPSGTICTGTSVTFTATPANGGTTPNYQWQVNGTNTGTNSSTFTSTTLNNGDAVTVILTSNAACPTPATATSNTITITVVSSLTPSVSIVSSGSTICAGDPVTFTATPTNGGTTPSYQWQVNGTNAGTNSNTFTSTTLANGDVVTVILTSNDPCASPLTATSNSINITVQSSVPASVSIASSGSTICAGDLVTFTATPTNGGTTPSYQWQVNGANAGTNSSTFSSTTLANGDVVTVIMTSSSSCATGSPATSNSISITVQSSLTPSVTISPANSTVCTGAASSFTATPTNGGTTPTYQWQVNGSNAGTNAPTFSSVLNSGDIVTVILTSNSACASPTTATSNTATVTVQTCDEPVANFSGTPTVMCQPGCVNFTDLSTNNPTSWSWSFPGATPSSSTLQNPTNICYSANGSYTVTLIVSNADGADTLIQTGYITVGVPVQVSIVGNLVINACEQTVLSAFPADGTYQWGPDVNLLCETCQSATVSPATTQQYWVTYTSPDGCVDSDTTVVVVTDIYTYFMPTAFSPNGDGANDVLLVRGRGIDYINLKIFDRIGEKVFETNDLDKGWDGKLLGIPMNDGVFVYMLEVQFCNGENAKEQGNLTLVK